MRQTSFHSSAVTGCTERRWSSRQAHRRELGVGLDCGERHRPRHRGDGFHVDALPRAGFVLGVGMGERDTSAMPTTSLPSLEW